MFLCCVWFVFVLRLHGVCVLCLSFVCAWCFCVFVVCVVCVTVCVPSFGRSLRPLHLDPPRCWSFLSAGPLPHPLPCWTHTLFLFSLGPPDAGPAFFFRCESHVELFHTNASHHSASRRSHHPAAETCLVTKKRRAQSGDFPWTTEQNSKSQRSEVLHSGEAKKKRAHLSTGLGWRDCSVSSTVQRHGAVQKGSDWNRPCSSLSR